MVKKFAGSFDLDLVELFPNNRIYIFYLLLGATVFGCGLERDVSFTPKE